VALNLLNNSLNLLEEWEEDFAQMTVYEPSLGFKVAISCSISGGQWLDSSMLAGI
jgi:hypothetical protein